MDSDTSNLWNFLDRLSDPVLAAQGNAVVGANQALKDWFRERAAPSSGESLPDWIDVDAQKLGPRFCQAGRAVPTEFSGLTLWNLSFDTADPFEKLFWALPMGLLLVDQQGQIARVNGELARMFGYSPKRLIGRPLTDLLPERYRASHPQHIRRFATRPQARVMGSGRDLTAIRASGEEFLIEVGISMVHLGNQPFYLASVVDLSTRRASELGLTNALDELSSASYALSHDVRGPLLSAESLLDWAIEDWDEPELAKGHIRKAADKLARAKSYVDQLQAFTQSGGESTAFSRFELTPLVNDVWSQLKPPSTFTLAVIQEDSSDQWTSAKEPLIQVLRHLLANAVEHHDQQAGRVEVEVISRPDKGQIIVRDDGPGIPIAAQRRVQRLFQTLDVQNDLQVGGVGLAVCTRWVKTFGGCLDVSAIEPRGTEVRLDWPRLNRSDYGARTLHLESRNA